MLPSSNRLNEKDPMVEAVVGSFLDPSSVFLSAAVSGTRRDTIPAITADQLTRPISVENRPESTKCPCSLLEQIEDSEIIDAVRVLTSKRKQILKRINETAQCLSSIVNYTYFRPQSCQSRKGTQVANRMVKLSQAELSRVIDTESKAAAALIPPPTSLKRQNSSSLLNAPRKRFALAKQGPYDLNDIMLAKAVEIVENGTDIDIFNYEIVVEALKRIPLIQAHIDPNMKFELEKRLINRAQRLAEDGMWSSLRMPKLVEPPKPQTTWDKTMAILCPHAYKSLVKYKATMNASHRRLMASLSKRFKNQGEDEKAMKRMAAQCSRLIDKYWKSVGKMYRGKQKLLHEQQYRQALDAHLKTLINRSQRYTELVRAAVDETDDNFIVQDDDGEFVGDEEDVSEEDVSWSDEENLSDDLKALEREGELALSELVKEALPTDLRRQWMSQNVYKEIDEDHETSLPLPPPEKKQKSSLIPVPFLIKGTLRPYQHTGIDWLSKLYMNGLNGILADEMGLGKTIQTIAFLAHLACEHGIWGPHLVVVPTSVVLNWEVEFKRWLPSFKLLTYYGSVRDRKERRKGWTRSNAFHVCITSYQTAIQDAYILKRRRWNVLVLDEAQQIKNFKSQRWQVLLGFRSRRRLLLTGTVLQNTLMELWSLMHFLMPKLFASHTDFKEWFSSPVASMIEGSERVNEHLIRRLHQVLRPFILRRLKNEVEREMPKKHEHVIKATLSKRQKFLYEDFMSRSDTKKALETGHYMSVINVLMQLRKVCNHPDLFETRLIHSPFVITDDLWCRFPKWMKIDRNVELGKSFVDLDRHETHCGAIRAHQLFPGDIVPKIDYRKTDRLLNEDRFTNIIDYPLADFIVNKNSSGQSDECANGLFYAYGADGNLTRSAQYPHIGQTIDFIKDRIDLLNRRNRQRIMFEVPIHGQTAMKFLALPPVECPLPLLQHGDLRHFHARNRIYVEAAIRSGDIYSETSDPIYPDRHFLQFDSGKLQILARLLAALKQDNHRVLIFSQMTRMLDIIAKFLSYHGYTYLRLDGTCDIERRQRMVETFNQNSRYFCFILSTRSGGLGLNLTGADTVVFYDSDWNPTMDAQAQDRCHRIGQTREVNVYRLICRHSVEESILLKANQKRILSQVVIDAAGLSQTRMTSQNIRSLFFTVDQNVHENVDDVIGDNQNNKEKILEQALLDAEDEMDRDAAAVVVAEAELDGMEFTEDTGLYKETQEQVKQIQHNIDSLTKEMKPIEKRSLHQMEKNPEDYNHILDSFSSKAPLPQETFAIKEDVDLLNDSDDREDDVMYTDDKVKIDDHNLHRMDLIESYNYAPWTYPSFLRYMTPNSTESEFDYDLYEAEPYVCVDEDEEIINNSSNSIGENSEFLEAKSGIGINSVSRQLTSAPPPTETTTSGFVERVRPGVPKHRPLLKDIKPFGQISFNMSKHISNCDAVMTKSRLSFRLFHDYATRALFVNGNRCRNARVYADIMQTIGGEVDRSLKNLKTYWEHVVSVAAAVAAESGTNASGQTQRKRTTKKTRLTDIRRNEFTIPRLDLEFGGLDDIAKVYRISRDVVQWMHSVGGKTIMFPIREPYQHDVLGSGHRNEHSLISDQHVMYNNNRRQLGVYSSVPPNPSHFALPRQHYSYQTPRFHQYPQDTPSQRSQQPGETPLPPIHTLSTYQHMMQQQNNLNNSESLRYTMNQQQQSHLINRERYLYGMHQRNFPNLTGQYSSRASGPRCPFNTDDCTSDQRGPR